MHIFAPTIARLNTINARIGHAVAWLTLGMVVVTFLVVVLRYFFDIGSIALQEAATYMHAMVFMLGAAYALQHDSHVRVDLFYDRFSKRGKAWVNLLGTLLLLLPTVIFLFWSSFGYVADSWRVLEESRDAGGLHLVWVLKSLLLITPILLAIQGVVIILTSLAQLRSPEA